MYVSAREKGFTLLELMITVAIVGILAAISIPSYMSHMVKVRRAAAAACLMEGAQYAERHYTTNMSYDEMSGRINDSVNSVIQGCKNEISTHYEIRAQDDAKSYTLTATPINRQFESDKKCGALAINDTGKKFYKGTEFDTEGLRHCW